MPISVACGGCGKRFRAPDRGAGKRVPCPACQTPILIPAPKTEASDEDRPAELPVAASAARPRQPAGATRPEIPVGAVAVSRVATSRAELSAPPPQPSVEIQAARWVPSTRSSTPTWLRHLHWCLALAMIPLAISIIMPDADDSGALTAENETPLAEGPAASGRAVGSSGRPAQAAEPTSAEDVELDELTNELTVEQLFALLPGRKLPGALLARDSWLHWLFAALSATLYLAFLVFLASDKSASPLHLLGLGLFTATGGILLLLFVQMAASIGVIRVRGAAAIVTLILALIGLSYRAALDPEMGFIASFLGFTFGVGLCEEVCKALPLLIYYRAGNQQTWRGAFLWGLASGVGFGVSEGVIYSQDFYNGVAGMGTYLVRFLSCVSLHGIWAGSIGIAINQRQELLSDAEEWWEVVLAVLWLIAIPAVLHGLYDTLLKKDLELLALLTAAASFGYLAWQIGHLRNSDDVEERAAYVSSYIRAKAASR